MKFIRKFWPVIFVIVVWFIFSYPYFLQNKVPYSSTYQVNHFFPWSGYPQYHGPVKNGAMPDITDQIYPWRKFTIETWKKGEIPLWNPNSFSGNPHLANYQSAVFSPLNLLFFIFPFVDAWSLLILLQPLTAGAFTYLLMREFKVSKAGSLISSLAFMFSGFMVVWMAYGTLSWAITFLPIAIYSIERWFNKRDKLSFYLLLLSIAFSFFSGHFQTSLYFLVGVAAFLAFKLSQKPKNPYPIVLSLILGILVSLVQIIPSIQLYLESVRSGIFINQGGIPIFYLVNLFAPDFFGNPVTRNDWFGFYAEWASFVGIVPLVLSIFALNKKNKTIIFFSVFSLLVLILAIDSPIQKLIADLKIPVISTSNPTRIIVLLSFSLTILSGFGFDRLSSLLSKKSLVKILPIILTFVLLFAFMWFSVTVLNLMSADKEHIAQRNFALPTIIFLSFCFLAFTAAFFKKALILYLIIFLVVIDSLRFAQKWMPFDPKELVFPDTPVVKGIEENIGFGRIFGNFGANMDTYYGFPGIEGYDPLYIERYGEFLKSAGEGRFDSADRSVAKISRRGEEVDRVLDLLGVSLIFHPAADTNQSWAYPVWEDKAKFVRIFQDGNFELYRNNTALERARIFYKYEVVKDKKQIIERFYSNDFDFRNSLILEESPELKSTEGEGSARIISYSSNKIVISVESTVPGLLFLSDNFYPGWKAKVNGKFIKIYRADYSFRAVEVPVGKSLVEFSYSLF